MKMIFIDRKMAVACLLVAAFWLTGLSMLPGESPSTKAGADNIVAKSGMIDAVKQSVLIYQAILEDVDKNYLQRGGGGIARIVQNSTTSYSAYMLQEGHEDVRIYEVRVASDGKVTISHVAEKTVTH